MADAGGVEAARKAVQDEILEERILLLLLGERQHLAERPRLLPRLEHLVHPERRPWACRAGAAHWPWAPLVTYFDPTLIDNYIAGFSMARTSDLLGIPILPPTTPCPRA